MSKDNIVLVGFMGAGKSVCGRLLARRLGRCFVETDDMIVAAEGRSIPEIFRREGAERFRQLEGEALELLRPKPGDVIATGGGFPRPDGAMGTLLYARGVSIDACFDVLNVSQAKVVQSVHSEYIAAGADCIETNTFGANRFKLAVHGLASDVHQINLRGVKLARDVRESMGRDVLVLGSVGPLGKYLAPLGTVTADEARAAFREQAEALLEAGIDP